MRDGGARRGRRRAAHDALGPRWRRWPLAVVARRARAAVPAAAPRAAAAAPSAHAQTLPTPTRAHKNYVATALSAAQRHATLLRAARCGQVAMAADGAGAEAAEGVNVDGARRALREADAVCFDVDSTVIVDEGIDVLADYLGCGAEVAALTRSAMGGSMPFHEALAARLAVMRPSRQQVEAMLEASPIEGRLTPGVAPLIAALQARGTRVFLVSGGFRQMIEPVAAAVGVAADDIFANNLLFDADGAFASHDATEPTSRAGGKARVVAELRAKHGFRTVVMVGDGATDMEARDAPGGADAFIGFGGVQARPSVRAGADWFVTSFEPLRDALS